MRYWEERAKEWAKARDKKEHKINAALVDSYKNAADDLQKEIAAWYEKYADAEGISFADAKKRLNERERRALTRSVKAFEKLAKQNKDHSQDKILTKMSAAVHINRLTSMQFQMRYILYELYSDVNNALTDGLKEFYADEREQMAYEAQMARGKFEPIATIDEKRISAVLKTPWATDGKDFSARLWNNREQLVSTLQSELTRAFITGADSASVAKTIAKKMNAAQYAASRLVSTEITRIITASDIDTFAEMDIDEVEVVGTLDLHTCDTCGDMDGNHMPRSEAKAGTTAPPFHPNCRCVIVPYFGDNEEARAMRDPVTGKSKIIENMTFKEWKEKYGTSRDGLASGKTGEKAAIEQKTIDGLAAFAYPGMTKAQNVTMLTHQKELLTYAMTENNSNEVAFLLDGKLNRIDVMKGDDGNVDVTAMMINHLGNKNLQMLHNHPTGSPFSMDDITVFVDYDCIKGLSLIANKGHIETLQKTQKYDRITANRVMQDVLHQVGKRQGITESDIVAQILSKLVKAGALSWKK